MLAVVIKIIPTSPIIYFLEPGIKCCYKWILWFKIGRLVWIFQVDFECNLMSHYKVKEKDFTQWHKKEVRVVWPRDRELYKAGISQGILAAASIWEGWNGFSSGSWMWGAGPSEHLSWYCEQMFCLVNAVVWCQRTLKIKQMDLIFSTTKQSFSIYRFCVLAIYYSRKKSLK